MCDYCNPEAIPINDDKVLVEVEEGELCIYFQYHTCIIPINYCPMCGRKLRDE